MLVVYFHGTGPVRDVGPPDAVVDELGVRLVRDVRPGYDGTPPMRGADLRAVASAALDTALAAGRDDVVVLGWSGGGPYALAAASLGRPEVRGVALLSAWAPMDPPDRGLPPAVRLFMRIGRSCPRRVLQLSLAAVGRRHPGQVDDIRRVARPWGFEIADVTSRVPVVAWHGTRDAEVPIAPWSRRADVTVQSLDTADHEPATATWAAALEWARSSCGQPPS